MGFPGGSAWAMVKDIGDGYITLNERSLKRFSRSELDKIVFELDRRVREVRADQPALDDLPAVQTRQRRLQRLTRSRTMVDAYRAKRR